jgi:hypothetical protein
MAIAQPGSVYYDSLYDVYTDVHLSRRLSGIAKAFGPKEGKAISVSPRIRWEPNADVFRPAEMGGEIAVRPGANGANQMVMIEEFDRRDAGAIILIYADTYQEMEKLVIKFRGALSDVLRATSVYQAPNGTPIAPEDDSQNTWCYKMPLSVRLLCADVYPVTSPIDSNGALGTTR